AVLKTDLFQRLGYGNNHDLIERVLEEAGLSRPSKQGIARSKEAAVSAALRAHFVIVCPRGDCQAEALHDGRVIAAAAAPSFCAICGGSSNGRAVDDMVGALKAAGMCRL